MAKFKDDFQTLHDQAMSIPEARNYLKSLSVIVGDTVLARRLQMNLSQAELAKRSGTTQNRISKIETGKGNVRQDVLDRVFEVLKLQDLNFQFSEDAAAVESMK